MDLSIIIVSWNVKERLKENLKSIYSSQHNLDLEIFVIDNNSADGSAEMIKKMFPGVKLIANKTNLGFSKANNQAIRQAQGKYLLLLNPDMLLFPDTLQKMFVWLENNPLARVVGPMLLDKNNKTVRHVRRFPSLFDQLAIILKIPHLFSPILNKYLCKKFDYSKPSRVDSVRGSFFVIRSWEDKAKNLLDENYFVWLEDVDYCRQMKELGEEVWYSPDFKCLDYIGQSFKQMSVFKTQKIFRDSMLKYFLKWHQRRDYLCLKFFWFFGLGLARLLAVFKNKNNNIT
jgi:GT2 family glycosyltransferase